MKKIFFVAILFFTACGHIKQAPENSTVASVSDSVENNVTTKELKSLPDTGSYKVKVDSVLNCEEFLHSLVDGSSFSPEVKKFEYKVGVDELTDNIATLKVTMRNDERNEDMAISWLKLDLNKKKLLDITIDPDLPKELTCDTILVEKINKYCRLNEN